MRRSRCCSRARRRPASRFHRARLPADSSSSRPAKQKISISISMRVSRSSQKATGSSGKPVLHAGEVTLTSSSINGTVVDSAANQPISGGTTVVALEQKDSSGIDRVVMETVTDASGAFSFCPVAAGTYDVVVGSVSDAQVAYAATVITGVQPGDALGMVPVTAQAGAGTAPASITGLITTSTGSAAASADISLSALQAISPSLMVTIPLAGQSATTANLTSAAGSTCPAKTDCASYTLSVPALNPSVGAFEASASQKPSAPAAGPV